MVGALAAILALLAVSACSSEAVAVQTGKGDPECQAVAEERTKDAGYNGFSQALQQKIYDGAYRDCLTHETKNSVTSIH